MTDLDELERKARALCASIEAWHGPFEWHDLVDGLEDDANLADDVIEFMRLTDPAVILALIERVRAAEARKPVSLPFDGMIGSDGQLYPKDAP